ncbi:hypothetical protein [Gracilibacillus alcaliphilus]|uniref:hypothetical protein n=1 Tax=Gracilibacillus alcaliphilus TaxID=1401441 RepID=UPI00195981BD|nr:hypothetical protein [Gracilibacillus alcaliphilus]MBM7675453.1 hypothetical protein [Gracilibacillus alcaliphilus]
MIYLVLFLVGFGLAISGGVSIILYLNFIPAGLSILDYLAIIQTKIECYFFFIGLICMGCSVHKLSNLSVK